MEVILLNNCWLRVGVFPLHQGDGGSAESDPGRGKAGSVGLHGAGARWDTGPGSAQGSAALPSVKALDCSCSTRPTLCWRKRTCTDVRAVLVSNFPKEGLP